MDFIKNIILDLGGVIINLDIPRSIHAFEDLGAKDFSGLFTQLNQTSLFDLYDKGQISSEAFLAGLREQSGLQVSNAELTQAWNAMLLDFPGHRLALLQTLKPRYRTFLLSNTNEIHIQAFEADLYTTHQQRNLQPYFEKVYYSCRMGMRKPDAEIFERLLHENQLNPEETLFIDDSPQHIAGARQTGIHAYLLPKGKELQSLLAELNVIE